MFTSGPTGKSRSCCSFEREIPQDLFTDIALASHRGFCRFDVSTLRLIACLRTLASVVVSEGIRYHHSMECLWYNSVVTVSAVSVKLSMGGSPSNSLDHG